MKQSTPFLGRMFFRGRNSTPLFLFSFFLHLELRQKSNLGITRPGINQNGESRNSVLIGSADAWFTPLPPCPPPPPFFLLQLGPQANMNKSGRANPFKPLVSTSTHKWPPSKTGKPTKDQRFRVAGTTFPQRLDRSLPTPPARPRIRHPAPGPKRGTPRGAWTWHLASLGFTGSGTTRRAACRLPLENGEIHTGCKPLDVVV